MQALLGAGDGVRSSIRGFASDSCTPFNRVCKLHCETVGSSSAVQIPAVGSGGVAARGLGFAIVAGKAIWRIGEGHRSAVHNGGGRLS